MEEVVEKQVSSFKKRFSDAIWFELFKSTPILLIGAGGIGSWVNLALSRIGCDITLFDNDSYDATNIAGQFCSMDQIGQNKASSAAQLARRFSGEENVITTLGLYDKDSLSNEVVIAAFDNMAGRKLAFEKWLELMNEDKDENKKNYIFIDGRLLSEQYQIYCVTSDPSRIERYKTTLFDDAEVPDVLCTLKSTTHMSMGIASDIVSILTNFFTNLVYGKDGRDVPYSIEKSIDLFTYDITM